MFVVSVSHFARRTTADPRTESPLYRLRLERAFLYCALPPLLLVAQAFALAAPADLRTAWLVKSSVLVRSARQPCSTEYDLDNAVERRCYGDGAVCISPYVTPQIPLGPVTGVDWSGM